MNGEMEIGSFKRVEQLRERISHSLWVPEHQQSIKKGHIWATQRQDESDAHGRVSRSQRCCMAACCCRLQNSPSESLFALGIESQTNAGREVVTERVNKQIGDNLDRFLHHEG